jgi:hypothetical protein
LRVENENGRHMFIGLAFNERNDAFDFNTALEDARREKEAEMMTHPTEQEQQEAKDYSMKKGEKIHISVNKVAGRRTSSMKESQQRRGSAAGGGFLKPSSKDTPRRGSNM